MSEITVTKHACVMADETGCGEHWYQATAEGHTAGACQFEEGATGAIHTLSSRAKLTAELVDDGGTHRLQLVDSKDRIVSAVAWSVA